MFFRREKQEGTSLLPFVKRLKEEAAVITQWLHYFHRKHDEHDIRLRLLEQHTHRKTKNEEYHALKVAQLDARHTMLAKEAAKMERRMAIILEAQEPILKKLEALEQSLVKTGEQHSPLYDSVNDLHQRLSLLEKEEKKTPVTSKSRIAEKIAKKSKEYVQHTILALIEKYGKIGGLQLREIVVDEQRLCSKSTFYRLLAELEERTTIGSLKQAKEKVYISQLEKHAF